MLKQNARGQKCARHVQRWDVLCKWYEQLWERSNWTMICFSCDEHLCRTIHSSQIWGSKSAWTCMFSYTWSHYRHRHWLKTQPNRFYVDAGLLGFLSASKCVYYEVFHERKPSSCETKWQGCTLICSDLLWFFYIFTTWFDLTNKYNIKTLV